MAYWRHQSFNVVPWAIFVCNFYRTSLHKCHVIILHAQTAAGERKKVLKKDAHELARDAKTLQRSPSLLPAARREAQRLQGEVEAALAEAEALSSRPNWRI
jgi:hypothetical protein